MDVVDDDISCCCLLVFSDRDEDVRILSLPTAERTRSLAALRELWMSYCNYEHALLADEQPGGV